VLKFYAADVEYRFLLDFLRINLSVVDIIGWFEALQAINIAQIFLFFQFHASLLMRHSIIATIDGPEILKKEQQEKAA